MNVFKGTARIADVVIGYDPMQKRSNGALIKRFSGDTTAKAGVFATYKASKAEVLTALTAYTEGTTMRTAWYILVGVDYPQNSMVTDLDSEVPVTAVFPRGLELVSKRLLVADDTGGSEGLCIVTAVGDDANVVVGQCAWGTPGEGSFSGTGPTVVAFGTDVHVTAKNIKGATPWVSFFVH